MRRLTTKDILQIIGKIPEQVKATFDTKVTQHCESLCLKYYPRSKFDFYVHERDTCLETCDTAADVGPTRCLLWVGTTLLAKYDITEVVFHDHQNSDKNIDPSLNIMGNPWKNAAIKLHSDRAKKNPLFIDYRLLMTRFPDPENMVDYYFPIAAQDYAQESWDKFASCLESQIQQIRDDDVVPEFDRKYFKQTNAATP